MTAEYSTNSLVRRLLGGRVPVVNDDRAAALAGLDSAL